ncbi:MAG TPA: hypothetical protein VHL58_12305 [Thermoanaerobaculia bacterium]|nr:hypothetical protein [Thermoanaerobaculia bacterium]
MNDEEIPRELPERTGRHRCTRCLAEVAISTYLANDHLCDDCTAIATQYPLASTPHGEPPAGSDEKR